MCMIGLLPGVDRLAGMSLSNPVRIDASVSESDSNSVPLTDVNDTFENFVVPEKLKQNFVITPCKLRLVTLAAFILLKCKVSGITF